MNDLIGKLKQPALWTISVQLLILYVVSVAIFFAAHAVQTKAALGLKDRLAKGEAGASAGVFLLAAVLNFLGVAALVFVTQKTGENVRMAMMILPLFLIIEQHVRHLRANPQDRRASLLGMAGVALGMIGGVAALMPNAPLK
ncbi:MAG: hypothetical protein Q8T11_08085 [Elusimicrobiota bacterium]|nr:hypothetical protein [Elusimicrobiota bacterium]